MNRIVMFSDFVAAAADEIIQTRHTNSSRLLRSLWIKWVNAVANNMNLTIDYKYDNWHIIERKIKTLKGSTTPVTSTEPSSVSSTALSSSNKSSSNKSSSSKSTLGVPLSQDDKDTILNTYDNLDDSLKWKLTSGRCVENVMRDFCAKSQFLHPADSLILDIEDENWTSCFDQEELEEIKTAAQQQQQQQQIFLPADMQSFLGGLPRTDDINTLFDYVDALTVNPNENRGLYFLKTTLLYCLDLFRTSYIPLSDQKERDLLRRVWIVIDWVFDGSMLKARNEKSSYSSKTDSNKKRKIAYENPMKRQYSAEIPDILVYYERYEVMTVEARKEEGNDTKKKNDCSKLAVTCKQMLLNLSHHAPSLQHSLNIIGMGISGMELTIYKLINPEGMVCLIKQTDELYFPVHMFEFRSKMIVLLKKLWLVRMEAEETFRAVCSSDEESVTTSLTPCFKK